MTREEQINGAVETYMNGLFEDGIEIPIEDYENIEEGFIAGVKWADNNPKSPWINAKNELPTKGGHYLCMDENHYISALAFSGDRWVNSRTFSDMPLDVVKYWMPIPNLSKGGEQ